MWKAKKLGWSAILAPARVSAWRKVDILHNVGWGLLCRRWPWANKNQLGKLCPPGFLRLRDCHRNQSEFQEVVSILLLGDVFLQYPFLSTFPHQVPIYQHVMLAAMD
jgi:hypothetical protein